MPIPLDLRAAVADPIQADDSTTPTGQPAGVFHLENCMPVMLNNKKRNFSAGVYRILNLLTGMEYIGSSVKIARRLKAHLSQLNCGFNANRQLQADWNQHGREAFIFGVLEFVESTKDHSSQELRDRVRRREQWWMDHAKASGTLLYNVCPSAFSALGIKRSFKPLPVDDPRREIARALGKQPKTAEHRAKISAAHLSRNKAIREADHGCSVRRA